MRKIYIAHIHHGYGTTVFADTTSEKLDYKVATWCYEYRDDAQDPVKVTDLFRAGDFSGVVKEYFNENETEFVYFDTDTIDD